MLWNISVIHFSSISSKYVLQLKIISTDAIWRLDQNSNKLVPVRRLDGMIKILMCSKK